MWVSGEEENINSGGVMRGAGCGMMKVEEEEEEKEQSNFFFFFFLRFSFEDEGMLIKEEWRKFCCEVMKKKLKKRKTRHFSLVSLYLKMKERC